MAEREDRIDRWVFEEMMLSSDVFILTVRFDEQTTYELKRILHAIGAKVVAGLTWGVEWLDWLGSNDASRFNRDMDTAPKGRLLVSGERLLELSEQTWQTVEGKFVGYQSNVDAQEFIEKGLQLVHFATSSAEIVIEAQDGSFFDVYLRSQTYADRLARRLREVHWQDPTEFLNM